MWRQSKAVWAVAFACVIAFMGIGLVDPILKPIADQLGASPSQVSLLFTSYMAVMGVAMLITGVVASRIGAKRTLLLGLVVIIIGAALAGMQDSINGVVAFRAVWGLGNALFIATALATIVSSAKGSVGQAIILYEAALGLGIAAGPLIGGELGSISWRGPFFGVSVLMAVALVGTTFLLRLQRRFGTLPTVVASLTCLSAILAAMAIWTDSKAVLASCVIVAGAFLGINNTLVTETVMKAAPVERGVASAAYSFVRFGGGAVAPWLAGKLGESINAHVPFWMGAGAVLVSALVLASGRRFLAHIDAQPGHGAPVEGSPEEAELVTVADA
ncbi:MAG: MFS transporter [Nocardioidaceae bacterium]